MAAVCLTCQLLTQKFNTPYLSHIHFRCVFSCRAQNEIVTVFLSASFQVLLCVVLPCQTTVVTLATHMSTCSKRKIS